MEVEYKTISEYGKYSDDLNKFRNFNSYVTNEYIHTLGLYIFECVRHITHNNFFFVDYYICEVVFNIMELS